MRGRVGVVGADHALELAQHATGFFLRHADDAQGTDALAVQREALGEAGGDEEVQAGVQELADHLAVFGNAFAKALVGHVEEGDQVAGLHGGDHLIPFGFGQVVAGGVVAAGVQHDHGAFFGRVQGSQHAFKVDATLGFVVVGVGAHGEAGRLEDGAVVFPARVRDQGLLLAADVVQEVGAQLQAAGAANGLRRDDAAFGNGRVFSAEHQTLHGLVVGGNAFDGQVATGLGGGGNLLLGRGHALEQRQLAVVVGVDAHTQVHLVGVGVGIELFVEAQDGVPGGHFNVSEQRGHASSLRTVGVI